MLSLIPISDANPTRRTPFVTFTLIGANVALFLYTQLAVGRGGRSLADVLGVSAAVDRYFFEHAPIPCQLFDRCGEFGVQIPGRGLGSFLVAVLFSTFLHAGIWHILGNMLFLWVFGNNVEDELGHGKFLAFYLLGGVLAALAHVVWALQTAPDVCTRLDPGPCVPAVGASGAVAAVMGAYILLFPHARVNVLVPIFVLWTVIQMSAFAVLGLWFLYQFLIAAGESAGPSGVAWMAHVGGFVFGVAAVFLLGGRPHRRPLWYRPYERY